MFQLFLEKELRIWYLGIKRGPPTVFPQVNLMTTPALSLLGFSLTQARLPLEYFTMIVLPSAVIKTTSSEEVLYPIILPLAVPRNFHNEALPHKAFLEHLQ